MIGAVSVKIRRVAVDELAAAADLTVSVYAPFTLGEKDDYVQQLRDVATRDQQAEVYVALQEGRLVGCVTSCPPGSPWRELAGPGEGEFRMLAVHPQARGEGTGAALVDRCEQRARHTGATQMVLSSLPEMTNAHRLYERLGYRRQPERDWSPVPQVHLIAYAKAFTDD